MAFVPSPFLGALQPRRPVAPQTSPLISTTTMPIASLPTLPRRSALSLALAAAASAAAAASLLPLPARADHTYTSARRSYERYYPRIVDGVAQVRDIGAALSGGSVDKAAEIVQGKLFDVKLRRALSIYATSFSDNYLGERSRDLLKCVEAFYAEMGKTGGNDGVEHYNRAVNALKNYFSIARLDGQVVKELGL